MTLQNSFLFCLLIFVTASYKIGLASEKVKKSSLIKNLNQQKTREKININTLSDNELSSSEDDETSLDYVLSIIKNNEVDKLKKLYEADPSIPTQKISCDIFGRFEEHSFTDIAISLGKIPILNFLLSQNKTKINFKVECSLMRLIKHDSSQVVPVIDLLKKGSIAIDYNYQLKRGGFLGSIIFHGKNADLINEIIKKLIMNNSFSSDSINRAITQIDYNNKYNDLTSINSETSTFLSQQYYLAIDKEKKLLLLKKKLDKIMDKIDPTNIQNQENFDNAVDKLEQAVDNKDIQKIIHNIQEIINQVNLDFIKINLQKQIDELKQLPSVIGKRVKSVKKLKAQSKIAQLLSIITQHPRAKVTTTIIFLSLIYFLWQRYHQNKIVL